MENKPKFKPDVSLKLMDQMQRVLRYYDHAYRTQQTYCNRSLRFIKSTAEKPMSRTWEKRKSSLF